MATSANFGNMFSMAGASLFLPFLPLIATLVVDALTLMLPYTPLAGILGFSPIPPLFLLLLAIILTAYMLTAEIAKHFFYQRMHL